jgi:ABC-type transport system involved in multi-copper enzyme maturation permease subunit
VVFPDFANHSESVDDFQDTFRQIRASFVNCSYEFIIQDLVIGDLMLKAIIKREILEYLKSSKFLIGLCLTIVLVGMSTFINIGDYQQRQQDYLDATQNLKEQFGVKIFRKPKVLSTLVQGRDRELGSQIEISFLRLPIQTSGYMGEFASQHHRYVSGFTSVDFAFVVRVVLSLMVIFLAYNSVSEETAQGTLRLAMANALPRGQLLFGKFIGGLFVILACLTIATLVAVLVMVLHPVILLDSETCLRILGMWTISALYLGVFFTLSLLVSTIFNRPSIGLLVLLQIWIVVIVIYPNVSVILSRQLIRLPGQEELEDRKRAIFEPFQRQFSETQEAFNKMVKSSEIDMELSKKNVDVNAQRTELYHRIDSEYSRQLTRQMHFARNIGLMSPSVLYDSIVQRIAGTDIREFDKFMEGVERHWYKDTERAKLMYTDYKAYREYKMPEFTYSTQSAVESFVHTLPESIVLFLLSVFFFAGAHTVFMRKNIG